MEVDMARRKFNEEYCMSILKEDGFVNNNTASKYRYEKISNNTNCGCLYLLKGFRYQLFYDFDTGKVCDTNRFVHESIKYRNLGDMSIEASILLYS